MMTYTSLKSSPLYHGFSFAIFRTFPCTDYYIELISLIICFDFDFFLSWNIDRSKLSTSLQKPFGFFSLCPVFRLRRFTSVNFQLGKALVLLVSLALICCHTYSYDLSTTWSAWGLTWLPSKRTHLLVGFVLICFQHLSASNTATGRLPLAG